MKRKKREKISTCPTSYVAIAYNYREAVLIIIKMLLPDLVPDTQDME